MDVATRTGVVLAQADLLPGHADHAVGGHLAAHPIRTGALIAEALRWWRRRYHGRLLAEARDRGRHLQGLMRAVAVVEPHPLVESLLCDPQIGERFAAAEEFGAKTTVKPFDLAGRGRTARLGQDVVDAVRARGRSRRTEPRPEGD